jgi:hypothetical protein
MVEDKRPDWCDQQYFIPAVGRRDKKKHPQTTQGQRSLPPTVGTTHRSRKRTYSKVIKKKTRCEGISDSDVSICPLPSHNKGKDQPHRVS